jgi:hypothetical protein
MLRASATLSASPIVISFRSFILPGAGNASIAGTVVDELGSSHVNGFQNESTGMGHAECFVVQLEAAHGARLAFYQIETTRNYVKDVSSTTRNERSVKVS